VDGIIKWRVARSGGDVQSYLAGDFYRTDAEVQMLQLVAEAGAKESREPATVRLGAARLIYEIRWGEQKYFDSVPFWSHRWLDAEIALATQEADRLTAVEAYLNRAKDVEQTAKDLKPDDSRRARELPAAMLERIEAQLHLDRAKAGGRSEGRARVYNDWHEAARGAYEAQRTKYLSSGIGLDDLYEFSLAWRIAAVAVARTKVEKVIASEAHVARMEEWRKFVKQKCDEGRLPVRDRFATEYYKSDAEVLLSETQAK
jgi:hypothetical protein